MTSMSQQQLHLKVFPQTPEMLKVYEQHSHNLAEDVGFDLVLPKKTEFIVGHVTKVDLEVKIAAYRNGKEVGYPIVPRSSITKTPLRLSNGVGVIDRYRGNLQAVFDCRWYPCFQYYTYNNEKKIWTYIVEAGSRLVQIIDPMYEGYSWEIVHELPSTTRGDNGFGSTGK